MKCSQVLHVQALYNIKTCKTSAPPYTFRKEKITVFSVVVEQRHRRGGTIKNLRYLHRSTTVTILLLPVNKMRNINDSSYLIKQVEFFLVYTFPFDGAAQRVGSSATRRRCDGSAATRRSAAWRLWRGPAATAPATAASALWLFGLASLRRCRNGAARRGGSGAD